MKIVNARNGWTWLIQGFELFRSSPASWILLVFSYWLMIGLLNQIPIVGPIVATLSLPAFSVSFMEICRHGALGRRLSPVLLFAGFRRQLATLVTMGGLYLLSIVSVLALSALADGGALMNWVIQGRPPPASAIRDGSLSSALLVAALAGTPVVMAFWFAPVLAAWQQMDAAKALFFSFFAAWRNWRAFVIYGAMLAVAGMVLSMAVTIVALLLRGQPEVLRSALLVSIIITLPTLFGSFYAAYMDIFPRPPEPEQAAAPN